MPKRCTTLGLWIVVIIAVMLSPCVAMAAGVGASGGAEPLYKSEIWPEARVLVWANPGTGGAFGDVANWTEKGEPAAAAPDRDTDVVLPEASKPYTVNAAKQEARHVTIGDNAQIRGAHRSEFDVWGNLDVASKGAIYFVSIRGPKHTFFRYADTHLPSPAHPAEYGHTGKGGGFKNRSQISHKFQVCKYGGASVEFIGSFGVSDEIIHQRGRLILNGDLRWSGVTGKGAMEIYEGAILELREGATVGPFQGVNNRGLYNIVLYPGGQLQAGSLERPLTADCFVMLGMSEKGGGSTGLFASKGAKVRVHSADPAKARLVFTSITSRKDYFNGAGKPIGKPDESAQDQNGIAVFFAEPPEFDGVHFDYVKAGGIGLPEADGWKAWKHVTFGSHNAGKGQELFAALSKDNLPGNQGYDSKPLTAKAIKSMQDYLKENDPYGLTSSPDPVTEDKKDKTPEAAIFKAPLQVVLKATRMPEAEIRYTLDGTEPTRESLKYTAPLRLTETTHIRARAYGKPDADSLALSALYVIQ